MVWKAFNSRRYSSIGDADLQKALVELETVVASHVSAREFDIALQTIRVTADELKNRTQPRGWISGSERLDRLCLSMGHEVRRTLGRRRLVSRTSRRCRVYVVSELYRVGGHTRLLEDLITAQPDADHHIIWTYGESANRNANNMSEILRVTENAFALQALCGNPVERLRAGFALLTTLSPDVLVHLGHPNDPIATALMQPDIARRRLMIHHSDSGFALGRSLKRTMHVALGDHFQEFVAREWGLKTVHLPLTCAEPSVTGSPDWTTDRPLLTVTSGWWSKFDLEGKPSYLDVLTARFAAREGAHVHIGFLLAEQKMRIEQHLDKLTSGERFVHKEHVPHLATALRELAPSVYIDSYPVGGGRAIVETMAAGLPICAARHDPNLDSTSFCYPECFWWTDPAHLATILARLDSAALKHHAALSRTYFERYHAQKIFKRRLQALLN